MEQNSDKISVRPQNKNLKPPFKEGESGNPNGRPKGQRNYATIRAEAIKAIGLQNGKTPEQIEEMLLAKGISEALKGDYRYYKDELDRTHGQAKQPVEHSGSVEVVTLSQEEKEALLALIK
jgi:hypothetical protein